MEEGAEIGRPREADGVLNLTTRIDRARNRQAHSKLPNSQPVRQAARLTGLDNQTRLLVPTHPTEVHFVSGTQLRLRA